MTFRQYLVFNYTTRKFEMICTAAILAVGEFINLPQGELQIWELLKEI